jgi:hypothetical protein
MRPFPSLPTTECPRQRPQAMRGYSIWALNLTAQPLRSRMCMYLCSRWRSSDRALNLGCCRNAQDVLSCACGSTRILHSETKGTGDITSTSDGRGPVGYLLTTGCYLFTGRSIGFWPRTVGLSAGRDSIPPTSFEKFKFYLLTK